MLRQAKPPPLWCTISRNNLRMQNGWRQRCKCFKACLLPAGCGLCRWDCKTHVPHVAVHCRVISTAEREQIVYRLAAQSPQISAGGSLANSLVAVSRLGASAALTGSNELRVSMAGCIGADAHGEYFQSQLQSAGVNFATRPAADSETGTVVVLTTPDAQRSFLSYFSPDPLEVDQALEAAVASSRVVVIEGYLWELPNVKASISRYIAGPPQPLPAHVCTASPRLSNSPLLVGFVLSPTSNRRWCAPSLNTLPFFHPAIVCQHLSSY